MALSQAFLLLSAHLKGEPGFRYRASGPLGILGPLPYSGRTKSHSSRSLPSPLTSKIFEKQQGATCQVYLQRSLLGKLVSSPHSRK